MRSWAAIVLLITAATIGGCGDGGDSGGGSTANSEGEPAPAAPPPAVGGGGGGASGAPEPVSQAELRRFRLQVNARCRRLGGVARVSAATGDLEGRRQEMDREIAYLKRLDKALAGLEAPTSQLQGQLDRYRSRLADQIALDRLIARAAAAEDEHSVTVGMDQNEFNRDARNAIVAAARFGRCLRAREPS